MYSYIVGNSMRNIIDKKQWKLLDGCCFLCGESDYDVLDVHRIVPASEGGKYTQYNSLTLCSNCHRQCHSGKIIIHRKYKSTKGIILHYTVDGVEKWDHGHKLSGFVD